MYSLVGKRIEELIGWLRAFLSNKFIVFQVIRNSYKKVINWNFFRFFNFYMLFNLNSLFHFIIDCHHYLVDHFFNLVRLKFRVFFTLAMLSTQTSLKRSITLIHGFFE